MLSTYLSLAIYYSIFMTKRKSLQTNVLIVKIHKKYYIVFSEIYIKCILTQT
jgi:hypothetical protein